MCVDKDLEGRDGGGEGEVGVEERPGGRVGVDDDGEEGWWDIWHLMLGLNTLKGGDMR